MPRFSLRCSRSGGVLLLLLAFILSFPCTCNFAVTNFRFFPFSKSADDDDDSVQISLCRVPPYQVEDEPRPDDAETTTDSSNSSATVTAAEYDASSSTTNKTSLSLDSPRLHQIATHYAPVLFFHPLEKYTLSSVDATFNSPSSGKIYQLSDGVYLQKVDDTLNLTTLLNVTRDLRTSFNAHEYFFARNLTEEYVSGAGYDTLENDTQNRSGHRISRAPTYYNVIDSGNNTWTFNYFFYYAWRGYSNMITVPSSNGTKMYTPFQLGPYGMHEGNWEHISVKVPQTLFEEEDDKQLPQPTAIKYRQHAFTETTDCTKGECHFFEQSNHPVGFVALFSHAIYPFPSYNHVYHKVPLPIFDNTLHGLYLVDRTNYLDDQNKMSFFEPNATNLIRLLDPHEVNESTPENEFWNAFGGHWGNITKPDSESTILPDCLNSNQTAYIACPTKDQDPAFYRVMQMFGVYPPDEGSTILQPRGILGSIANLFADPNTGQSQGPVTQLAFHESTPTRNAPIWNVVPHNSSEEGICKAIVLLPDTDREHVEYQTWNIKGNILGVIVMCIILPVGTSIFLWWLSRILSDRPNLLKEEDGVISPPPRGLRSQIYLLSIAFTIWYFIAVMGATMFALAYDDIFHLLNRYFPIFNWDLVTAFLENLCIIFIILDSLLVIVLWISSYMLQTKLWHIYFVLIGDHENSGGNKKRCINQSFQGIQIGFIISFGFLLVSMMLAVVFVIVSVAVVGFSYGFSEICFAAAEPLDGICIDLTAFGGSEIRCGYDFQQFCNSWVNIESSLTLWGSCTVAVGHYFLIGIGGMIYYQQATLNSFIASWKHNISAKETDQNNGAPFVGQDLALLDAMPFAVGSINMPSEDQRNKAPEIEQEHALPDGMPDIIMPPETES